MRDMSRQLSTDWIWDWSSRDHLPKYVPLVVTIDSIIF